MQIAYQNDVLNVSCFDEGSGEALVFLHGWGANAATYASVLSLLTPHFRVIAPDFPGFGGTDEPSFAYSVEDYAAFVLLILKQKGIQKAHFVGHSHGGRVILYMAEQAEYAPYMNKLLLFDSAGMISKKSIKKKARIALFKTLKKVVLTKPVRKRFPDALPALRKRFGSADYASVSPVLQNSMVKLVNRDLSPDFGSIRNPVLLVWGEKDDATPLWMAEYMKTHIPDAGLVVIPGAGHFSFLSDLPLVERVMASYFTDPIPTEGV